MLNVQANSFDLNCNHINIEYVKSFTCFHGRRTNVDKMFLKLFWYFSTDDCKCRSQIFAQRSNFSTGIVSFSGHLRKPIFLHFSHFLLLYSILICLYSLMSANERANFLTVMLYFVLIVRQSLIFQLMSVPP